MKNWVWLVIAGGCIVGAILYWVERSKDEEAKRISAESAQGVSRPPSPPTSVPSVGGGNQMPEPRRRGEAPNAYPENPPPAPVVPGGSDPYGGSGGAGGFDNLPNPPSQIYPDSPPPPSFGADPYGSAPLPPPMDPEEFQPPGDFEPPPDPLENVDPQYIPSEPLDGDIIPPEEDF